MKTYTLNECSQLLHVDAKTFRKWLDEAGINPDDQVSRADRRVRFLTQAQVEMLAEEHGRRLGTLTQATPISPGAIKLLEARVLPSQRPVNYANALWFKGQSTV